MGERREQAGALGAIGYRTRIERRRVGRVETAALRRQQVVVDGLGEQGVAESVASRRRRGRSTRSCAASASRSGSSSSDSGCAATSARSPGSTDRPSTAAMPRTRCASSDRAATRDEQHVPQASPAGAGRRCRLAARGEELLDEEGVALRPSLDRLEEVRLRRVAEDRLDLRAELAAPERRQLDPSDPRQAVHLGQPRAERMAAMELVRPVGADDDEALGPDVARQEGHEIASRAIGPVEVLEDAHDRRPLAEVAKEGEQALEDPGLDPLRSREASWSSAGRGPELGHQSTELGRRRGAQVVEVEIAEPAAREDRGQAPQRLDEWRERQAAAVAQADASALEDERAALARPLADLRRSAGSCRCRPRRRRGRRRHRRRRPARRPPSGPRSSASRPMNRGLETRVATRFMVR